MPIADSDPTLVLFAPGAEENTTAPLPSCIAGCAAAIGNDSTAISMEITMSGTAMRMIFFLFMDGTFLLGYLIICSVYDIRKKRTIFENVLYMIGGARSLSLIQRTYAVYNYIPK